jgi:hypothetical protein
MVGFVAKILFFRAVYEKKRILFKEINVSMSFHRIMSRFQPANHCVFS